MSHTAFSHCEICTNTPDNCKNLHIFYLIGSILTMFGCMFVIATYMSNSKLREHPAVLIFSRCLFDFLFGLCFFIQFFISAHDLACIPSHCNILGAIILFCFLASQGYFAASIRDLYVSLKNPFSQPFKDVARIHIYIFIISLSLTLFVSYYYSFAYRLDLQYCSIATSETKINPYNVMLIYIPVSSLVFISVGINIYAIKRLRVGLEDTFYIRMQSIKDSLFYCLGYTFYFAVLGLCYFMVWNDDQINNDSDLQDENGWHYLFALTVAFLGLNDCGLWIYRQFKLFAIKQEEKLIYAKIANVDSLGVPRKDSFIQRNTLLPKQFIAPALPQHIAYENKVNNNNSNQNCFKKLSFKPTIGEQNINKALRREVLAYSTDGIAQSIDRQLKLTEKYYKNKIINNLCESDYPLDINDENIRTMQRFNIVIRHNKYLLYEQEKEESELKQLSEEEKEQQEEKLDEPFGVQRVSTKLVIGGDDEMGIGKGRQFVDFAPLVFKYIRNNILGISDESYNKSIIPSDKYAQRNILDAFFGEGKSGAFFYFSHDQRYLIKTIKKFEVEIMLNTLQKYVEYINKNHNTILARIIGLHSIRLYGLNIYFVVSENVFLSKLKPSEVYDLKGSWVGRYTKYNINSGKTLKDGDLKRFIVLNNECRIQLINQLEKDSKYLSDCNIMDYSLLLGIYHLKMLKPQKDNDIDDEKYINNYAGGIRAEIVEGPGLYYMGIIDTLQVYNFKKKMENFAKIYIKRDDANGISCVEPIKYQKRFMNYMKNIIVTDKEYIHELNVPEKEFQNQNVLVYPGKQAVDKCIAEAQKQNNNNPQNMDDF